MQYVLLIVALAITFLSPTAQARYTDIDYHSGSQIVCGLLEDGRAECLNAGRSRELQAVNGDAQQTYTDIEVGSTFFCGITPSAGIACRGAGGEGQLEPPQFDAPVVRLDAAAYHSCAVDSSNALRCWGQGADGTRLDTSPLNGYLDVSSKFKEVCALRVDGGIDCWADFPNRISRQVSADQMSAVLVSPLVDLENEFTRYCGNQSDGTAVCVHDDGGQLSVVGVFTNGPYVDVFAGRLDLGLPHCALTALGELDCVNDTSLSVTREPGLYRALAYYAGSTCRYTMDNRMECVVGRSNNNFISNRLDPLLRAVNGELDIPGVEFTDAESYGSAVELFFTGAEGNLSVLTTGYAVEIYRDDELLVTTENNASWFDGNTELGRDYTYTARLIHQYGQAGAFSAPLLVNTSAQGSANGTQTGESSSSDRPYATTGLRAEIYWFDVELFWDRVPSGEVAYYEIRRDGQLIATTRGVSYYDGSSTNGQLYVYDVIAIAPDNSMLGFQSTRVQIGENECSF